MASALDLSYSSTIVFFPFEGDDETNAISESGSAELGDDGMEIAISFHLGDDGTLTAEQAASLTPS